MLRNASRARYLLLLPAVLILSGFLGFIENFFLYHPRQSLDYSPALYKIPFEEVRFRAADGTKLHGWYIPPAEPEGPVLLWAHGNAGNISHRAENAAMIRSETGAGMFLFDYRGYGKSAGRPNEEGLYADGRAAYAWLKERVPPGRIFLFGRSLGAAVTVKLAAEGADARGLILESPFLSLLEMAQNIFPFLPVRWIVSQKFDNQALLPRIKMPIFILHGDADGIVPFAQGKRLFEIAPAPKRFFRIEGAGHNDTYLTGGRLYWDAWRSFLRKPD